MHEFLSFNHKVTLASKIVLPAVSPAAFYGRGIFTSLAIYNSKPFQWEKHWQRLTENAETIRLDLSEFTEETVKSSLKEIIDRNDLRNGRARITFFDESANGVWQTESRRRASLLIASADFRQTPNNFRLTISPYKINSNSPLVNVKSCNYLEKLLILEESRKRGFDEAICLNEKNEIVSAALGNVFWTRNGEIFTPASESGALKGTTRDFVLNNFSVHEKQSSLDEIKTADEIFLTSAGIGIARIGCYERRNLTQSKIYAKVRELFDDFTGKMS